MRPSYHRTIAKEYFTLLGLVVVSIIVVLAAVWLLVRTPQPNSSSITRLKAEGSSSYQSGAPSARGKHRGGSSRLRYRVQLPCPTLNYDGGDISYFNSSEGGIPEHINSNNGFKLDVSSIRGRGNVSNSGSRGGSEVNTAPTGSEVIAPTTAPSSTTLSAL